MTRISNHCLGELFRNMTFLKIEQKEVKMTPDKLLPAFETTGGLA